MKAAVVILAGTESHETARAMNALIAAKEFKQAGDDIRVIFDGAGTRWVGELGNPDHSAHGLFEAVKDRVSGACAVCADAFGAREAAEEHDVHLLDEYDHHPSIRSLVADGFQVLTF